MPELDGKKYNYTKKGKAEYNKDILKKLKKKRKSKSFDYGDNMTNGLDTSS